MIIEIEDEEDERREEENREVQAPENPRNAPETSNPTEEETVDSELYETFIDKVLDGVSNQEWNEFQGLMAQEKQRDEERWKRLCKKETSPEAMDQDDSDSSDQRNEEWNEEIEPSQTLATPTEEPGRSPPTSTRITQKGKDNLEGTSKGAEYQRYIAEVYSCGLSVQELLDELGEGTNDDDVADEDSERPGSATRYRRSYETDDEDDALTSDESRDHEVPEKERLTPREARACSLERQDNREDPRRLIAGGEGYEDLTPDEMDAEEDTDTGVNETDPISREKLTTNSLARDEGVSEGLDPTQIGKYLDPAKKDLQGCRTASNLDSGETRAYESSHGLEELSLLATNEEGLIKEPSTERVRSKDEGRRSQDVPFDAAENSSKADESNAVSETGCRNPERLCDEQGTHGLEEGVAESGLAAESGDMEDEPKPRISKTVPRRPEVFAAKGNKPWVQTVENMECVVTPESDTDPQRQYIDEHRTDNEPDLGQERKGTSTPEPGDRLNEDGLSREEDMEAGYGTAEDGDGRSSPVDSEFSDEREPFGMKYIPKPDYLPRGLLASKEMTIYGIDDARRERHIFAKDVTLALEDPTGEPVMYHGDVTMRLDEPEPGSVLYVPKRDKVKKAYNFVFSKSLSLNQSITLLTETRKTDTPEGNEIKWNGLTQYELEAVIDELERDPLIKSGETRSYSIQKKSDGTVEVRNGFSHMRTWKQKKEKPQEKETTDEEWIDDGFRYGIVENQLKRKPTSKSGSDPPASDRKLDANGQGRDSDPSHGETSRSVGLGNSWTCNEGPDDLRSQGEKELVNVFRIKETELTDEENPATPTPLTPGSAKTESANNGKCSCGRLDVPELTRTSVQTELAPSMRDRPPSPPSRYRIIDLPVPENVPSVGEVVDVDIPPPEERSPGILAAAHITQLPDPTLGPDEISYFAYGAIIVGGGKDQPPFVRRGQAYVRLFTSNLDNLPDRPLPPPAPRVLEACSSIFQGSRNPTPDTQVYLQVPRNTPFEDQSVARQSASVIPPPFDPRQTTAVDEHNKTLTRNEIIERIRKVQQLRVDSPSEDEMDLESNTAGKHDPIFNEQVETEENLASDDESDAPLLQRPRTPHPMANARRSLEIAKDLDAKRHGYTRVNNESLDTMPDSPPPPPKVLSCLLPPIETLDALNTGPDSPKIRYYQDDIEDDELDDDEVMTDGHDRFVNTKDIPSCDLGKSRTTGSKSKKTSTPDDPREQAEIDRNLSFLAPYLDYLQECGDRAEIFQCLASLGLLQIAYDIGTERWYGKEPDREYWGAKISHELEERKYRASKLLASKEKEAEEGEKMRGRKREVDYEGRKKKRVKEEERDEFGNRAYTAGDWFPDVQAPPYPSDNEEEEEGAYLDKIPGPSERGTSDPPSSPEPDDFEDIATRVSMLEDRVYATTESLKEKITSLEDQVFADGCLLTELQWKINEARRADNEQRADQIRMNRRQDPRVTHRYLTRSVTAAEGRTLDTKKVIARISGEIKTLEGKIEDTRAEITSIKGKMDSVLCLAPDIEKLAKVVEENYKIQNKTTAALWEELDSLKNVYGPSTLTALKDHSLDIAVLASRFQYLYQVVISAIYSANARPSNQDCATQDSPHPHVNPTVKTVSRVYRAAQPSPFRQHSDPTSPSEDLDRNLSPPPPFLSSPSNQPPAVPTASPAHAAALVSSKRARPPSPPPDLYVSIFPYLAPLQAFVTVL
ncbi:hypothetical protein BJ322DRAFT_1108021 [Thelephora terrestris]|uniref:Uncharacterized protein n=1 Tax=Thelephora terrestris TaxID=56493 RepID=A0A9P6HFK8_9AGAM|nr:hypothetical protein BJ322DRAFT_1108021 [Thelephora terrestris]